MKKTIVALAMSFCLLNWGYSQQIPSNSNQSPQELYDFHIKKKNANKLGGWVAIGSGTIMIVSGLAWNLSGGVLDNDTTNNNDGLWLSYLGGAVTLTSIPFFIAAGKHKKKAEIQLKNGAIGLNREYKYSGMSISFTF